MSLADYDRWLHKAANDCLGVGHAAHDDLVQEGRIAMWRAEDTHDPDRGAKPAWVTGAARMRMRDVAWSSGQWTGREATRGRREVSTLHLERIPQEIQTKIEPRTPDIADGAALAYHRAEIESALARLTPAERRAARKVMHNRPRTAADRASWVTARRKLASELEHLRGLVA